jgi:hypothetical protein
MKNKMKKPLLHRSWDILSQAVLGASCSKFCEAKGEAASCLTFDLRLSDL